MVQHDAREYVLPLGYQKITLTLPVCIGADDFTDLCDWLEVVKKSIGRHIMPPDYDPLKAERQASQVTKMPTQPFKFKTLDSRKDTIQADG